ncbi:hypothetical protein [Stenotrophomonas sp. T8]|uniref:hypothetical protein n=1 Tax=Stenotrophomonas sp. T8 TaxID=3446365 RepID=UPI003F723DAC
MSNDNKTLADVQPGGRVRLGQAGQFDSELLWWLMDAASTLSEGGNESHAERLRSLHAALSAQPSPGGQDALDLDRVLSLADVHAEESREDGVRLLDRGGLLAFAQDVAAVLAARQPVREPVIDYEDLLDQAKDLIHCGCSVNGAFDWLLEQLTGGESLAAPPAQAVDLGPLWVSVNDRLPSEEDYGESGDVVVRYRYNTPNSVQGSWDVGESRHDADDIEWNNGWLFGSCDYAEVSHWMPKHALLALLDRLAVGQ